MNAVAEQRSTFVTVVAWLFIITAGFATFISLLQNITLHFLFPMEKMQETMYGQPQGADLPPMATFMFEYMEVLFGLMLLLTSLTLAAAIGLLLRKNWARITFVILMILGVVWNLGSLAAQQLFFRSMPVAEHAPADFVRHTQGMMNVMNAFSLLLALLLCLLFGWIAWKLTRPEIRAEFAKGGNSV